MRPITAARSLLALCLAFATARAMVHSEDITFRPSQFRIESGAVVLEADAKAGTVPRSARTRGTVPVFAGSVPRYDVVLGDGMEVSDEPGAPQLPVQRVVIALSGHQQVTNVTFEVGEWQALEGQHMVLPVQKQQVLSAGARGEGRGAEVVAVTQPNADIYRSYAPYPSNPVRWTGTSYRLGTGTVFLGGKPSQSPHESTFVQVLVYPVRYIGAEKRLEVCREVEVRVEVEGRANAEARGQKLEGRSLSSPQPSPLRGEGERSDGEEAFVHFEYVIVTGAGLDTVFQRLADWKTAKGVPAVVRTMDWVYANYTGRDQAEQLRNYLKTLPDSGVKYVLLGGDVGVVPFRKAFAMVSEAGLNPREDSLPCDLYFADLDGSWDANNNDLFGEVGDSVDLYTDLSVGRAPVNNVAQAQTFVRKVIGYELGATWDTIPNVGHLGHVPRLPGYQNKGLFFAEVLWQNPYTDMGVHKNKMEQQSFASGYSLTKLYQGLGNETRDGVMQAMRENQNFMNHDGHGWIDVMSCGGSANRLRTADADTITNAGLGVLYSIGCWTTAFDFTSIGEAFVTNPNGGTVATIGNSSYGWGSPGNPGFGYSDKFDNHFWHATTSEDIYRVGDALAAAKEYYAPFSHDENVYRWHQYVVNLMGDPEMPVWTALPESLDVTAPSSIGIGAGRYQFSVTHGGVPVPGATVCLSGPGDVYSRGSTDNAGQTWLDVEPKTTGQLRLCVTAHNSYPWEGTVACDSGNYVNFAGWRVDDRAGNSDGIANPGETLVLPFVLRNTGSAASGAATVKLATDDSMVTLLDSVASIPGIGPGDSVLVDSGLRVAVAGGAADGAAVRFTLNITSSSLVPESDIEPQSTQRQRESGPGSGVTLSSSSVASVVVPISVSGLVRTFLPLLQVGAPVIAFDRSWLNGPPLLPGASRGLSVRLENRGHGYGHSTWCRLVSLDNFITVVKDSAGYGEVAPLSYGDSSGSFEVAASGACPTGHVALMELQMNADGFTGRDTFDLLVGEYGFSDDMEHGEAKWTHTGTGDLWHLTAYRTHSGSGAWYCGNESSRLYDNRMDASLMTAPFSVPQGCSLRFWRWFKTPNYGVDGIRVIVMREGAEETLDFLGTGGALGRKWSSDPVPQWSSEEPKSGNPATRSLDHLTTRPLLLNQSGWAEEKYDLSWLRIGEQIGLRFTFVSDGDTVDEGFYIDDVSVTGGGPPLTVAGVVAGPGLFPALDVWPNPFRLRAQVRYGLSGDVPRLSIYDRSGRLVRQLPASRIATWDGRDSHGRRLPAGAYFIEARTRTEHRVAKVLLAR